MVALVEPFSRLNQWTVAIWDISRSALQLFTNHSSRPDAIGRPGNATRNTFPEKQAWGLTG
ncbi:hypothetical protein NQZ68_025753 [Dissostichus eleginoides]|nr:hypothetical protein NQZ68_025753 [Dissostichus eleginoides]